jgi:hypothetical protein
LLLEQTMLTEEIPIPVYFAKYSDELNDIITEISRNPEGSTKRANAMTEIFNKISANGYQIMVAGASNSPRKDSKIPVIQGELLPFKSTSEAQPTKLPAIIVTTQLKTFGITNDMPPNYDTTVLLTLIDSFSKLYNQMTSSAKYRVIFVLHESGSLLNFQGAKKFLDSIEEANIQNAEFALCLDSFAESDDAQISMHVSKPVKDGAVFKFSEILKKKAELYGGKTVESVHKKINLADTFHKWSHERFSMKRMAAFTLSSLRTHTDPLRTSIFTQHSATSPVLEADDEQLDQEILSNIQTNAKILAESLAEFIFNLDLNENENNEVFTGALRITSKSIRPYIAPRSMSKSQNVKMTFEKFLKNVKLTYDKPDVRDPEFMFYDGDEAKLNVYK